MPGAKFVEYMCKYCGKRETKSDWAGRPWPGECPRKQRTKDNKLRPHTWVVNRRI